MLIPFFYALREGGLKPSLTEFLTLLDALKQQVASYSIDDFYYLARTSLVKDESKFDKFDRVFGTYFKGIEDLAIDLAAQIPEEWLRRELERFFTDEEKAKLQAMGWDKLMETLKQRLEEQKKRHEGGNKWIGTNGTSPFGHGGFNPEGIRIGGKGGQRQAVKVWEQREYANYDDTRELGTRNLKIALRRLRKFARQGAEEVLDLDDTIRSTARNAGYLDLKLVPERHNTVKVLIFFDVGGSMDGHIKVCEELFSAAKSEFKHLEYFYFHNFIYESVWKDNVRRNSERHKVLELLHKYPADYKVIFVGDASMSPYEITMPGGSVEHWNEESGAVWMKRVLDTYPKSIWLNPESETHWSWTPSIEITRELFEQRMFPLTIAGLELGMKALMK